MGLKHLLILIVLCIAYFNIFAQKEGNNWIFGESTGINFNTIPPSQISNFPNFRDVCSSISSNEGKLLFFTNASTVWDSSKNIMLNGTGLNGYKSFFQTSIIIPKPNNDYVFYIFTADYFGLSNGFQYSEVNMKLNGGFGRVVKKNTLIQTPVCSSITAISHANQKDFWVVIRGFGNDFIYSYLVTENGVNTSPVISRSGILINLGRHSDGAFKISPDGTKIAATHDQKDTSFVADFDKRTGKVTNVWKFYSGRSLGLEFSENSTCLYINDFSNQKLLQFNLTKSNFNDFINSRYVIDSSSSIFNLQIGPDKKIYYTIIDSTYLNVIHHPDSIGFSCRIQRKYINLGSIRTQGYLPNFVQSFFHYKAFNYTRNCLYDSTLFSILETNNLDSVKWDFGDTSSGSLNYSNNISDVFHIYNKVGIYKVTLQSFYKGYKDDYSVYVYVNDPKPKLGNDTSFCNAFNLSIKPHKDYLKYQWNTSDTLKTTMPKQSGQYILTALDSAGCYSKDSINIQLHQVKAAFSISDSVICKNNVLFATDTSIFDNNNRLKTTWIWNGTDTISNLNISLHFSDTGLQSLKMLVESDSSCTDTLTKWIQVKPNSTIGFEINQEEQCLNGNVFDFEFSSILNSSNINSYEWNLGDGSQDFNQNVIGKTYLIDSNYVVTLVTVNDANCSDTLSKFIAVHPNPKAGFNTNSTEQCFNLNSFEFKNTSTIKSGNLDSIYWNTGDMSIYQSSDVTHAYQTVDSFNVMLKVFSDKGCMDSSVSKVYVYPNPVADIQILRDSICLDNEILNITNLSSVAFGTLSHHWDFGDGTSDTSRTPLNKKYSNNSGVKTIQYIVSTGKICSDTFSQNIQLLKRPKAGFTINDSIQCLKNNVFKLFTNQTSNSILWHLGDGNQSNLNEVQHSYSNPGKYAITLTTTDEFGCYSEDSIFASVISSPKANFSIEDSSLCINDALVKLQVNSTPNASLNQTLDWGDNTILNSVGNGPYSHQYSKLNQNLGNKTIRLFTELGDCKDTLSKTITLMPVAALQAQTRGQCIGDSTYISSSILNGLPIKTYKWSINDQFQSDQNKFVKWFDTAGTFRVKLKVESDNTCQVQMSYTLIIATKPKADFYYRILHPGEEPIEFEFNDQSTGAKSIQWYVDNNYESDASRYIKQFNDTGYTQVMLIAKNGNTCYDTFSQIIPVYKKFEFYFPNAFTPNGNSINETFGLSPSQAPFIKTYRLRVFNRWGEMVFESNDPLSTWKAEKAQLGMYIYTADIRDIYNQLHQLKGVVLLVE
jgi:PKD repeat protein